MISMIEKGSRLRDSRAAGVAQPCRNGALRRGDLLPLLGRQRLVGGVPPHRILRRRARTHTGVFDESSEVCGHEDRRHLQEAPASGAVFQGPQAEPAGEDLRGASANGLKIQIWTALIAILLPRYLKPRARWGWSLSNLVALLRQQLFVHRELFTWLDEPFHPPPGSQDQP